VDHGDLVSPARTPGKVFIHWLSPPKGNIYRVCENGIPKKQSCPDCYFDITTGRPSGALKR
jgi:hypothetical protein